LSSAWWTMSSTFKLPEKEGDEEEGGLDFQIVGKEKAYSS